MKSTVSVNLLVAPFQDIIHPDNYDKLVADIQPFNKSKSVSGIYVTLQDINPALEARAANRLKYNVKHTTSDTDVKSFAVFPIDIDSDNPAGTSASEPELEASKVRATAISELLQENSIPHEKAMSGNGWHILIYIDKLECSEENIARFKALGDLVAHHYGSDVKNYNPSRVWKLYGTWAGKGDDIPKRPHRESRIYLNEAVDRIDFETLEDRLGSILTPIPVEEKPTYSKSTNLTSTDMPTLEEWLDKHNISYTKKPYKEAFKYQIDCPHDPTHKSPDAWVTDEGGSWQFSCSHNSCKNQSTWQAYKDALGIVSTPKKVNSSRQNLHNLVSETPRWTDTDIDTETEAEKEALDFPKEIFFDIFEDYRVGFGNNPIPDAFIFATMKQLISIILGRGVYIETDPVIYPNFFTGLIGGTASTNKGNSLKLAKGMLRDSNPNVIQLAALATSEGLINLFNDPSEYTDNEDNVSYSGGFAEMFRYDNEMIEHILNSKAPEESIRLCGFFGEFGGILQKANKITGAGMLETLMLLYDHENQVDSPTKGGATSAKSPTFGMIGASTIELIEIALDTSYIAGGLTNRFEWYLGNPKPDLFLYEKFPQKQWNDCVQKLGSIRGKFPLGTEFTIDSQTQKYGQEFTNELGKYIEGLENQLVSESLKRAKFHVLKNSLLFACLLNEANDTVIKLKHLELAIRLSEYTNSIVEKVFGDFAPSKQSKVEKRIIEILRNAPKLLASQIHNRMNWADRGEVITACEYMRRHDMLGATKSSRGSLLYFAIK